MADPEGDDKSIAAKIAGSIRKFGVNTWFNATNLAKFGVNAGLNLENQMKYRTSPYKRVPLYEKLENTLLTKLKLVLKQLFTFEGEGTLKALYPGLETLKYTVRDILRQVGPYTESPHVNWEMEEIEHGTKPRDFPVKFHFMTTPITIQLPGEKKSTFTDGHVENIHYYGSKKTDAYLKNWTDQIRLVFQAAETYFSARPMAPGRTKDYLHVLLHNLEEGFIDNYLTVAETIIKKNETFFRDTLLQNVKTELGTVEKITEYAVGDLRAPKDFTEFYHNFWVINVDYPGDKASGIPSWKEWAKKNDFGHIKGSGRKTKAILDHHVVEMHEEDHGLDEYGMPLEVMDDGDLRIFLDVKKNEWYGDPDKWYQGEDYSKDPQFENFKKLPIRKIPSKYKEHFIRRLPIIDIMGYLHNAWDETRDDLRDGRYHKHSTLAIDYTFATANIKGRHEWKSIRSNRVDSLKGGKSLPDSVRSWEMRLADGRKLKGDKRDTSQLAPTLDLSALDLEYNHIGKLYYYSILHDINYELQPYGCITTRGLSSYIINRVIRKVKTYEEFDQFFNAFAGEEKNGIDWGPRVFGDDFHKHPFKLDLSQVNKKMTESQGDEGYTPEEISKLLNQIDFNKRHDIKIP